MESPSVPCDAQMMVRTSIDRLFHVAESVRNAHEENVLLAQRACQIYHRSRAEREHQSLLEQRARLLRSSRPDQKSGTLRRRWQVNGLHMERVRSIASMDSTLLASGSDDGMVIVQTMPEEEGTLDGDVVGVLESLDGTEVTAVALIPAQDGVLVAGGGRASEVAIWRLDHGESSVRRKFAVSSPVADLAECSGILGIGVGRNIETRHLEERHVQTLAHAGVVAAVRMPAPRIVCSLSTTDDGRHWLTLWDVRQSRHACRLQTCANTRAADTGAAVAFDALCGDGVLIAAAAGNLFESWDVRRALRPLGQCDLPRENPVCLALRDNHVAVGCADPEHGALLIGDVSTGGFQVSCEETIVALHWGRSGVLVGSSAEHSLRGFVFCA
uniref:Uncharacterized protein n=1 Tax=Noctiluca scintillans TaxID=2966 RepID=A0A7S1AJV9_NOCSC|mmetsp:Transcript_49363/g.130906  ORF Transcript_49363/g.130906 Transcript_49363/m.130906 type:complete len:385 (+) Transcript_49363:52-1206(+)